MIQLTSHMKTCHTNADEAATSGNAITVNTPSLPIRHFFCSCSLCGEGYDDYSQLSNQEQHNFKCEVCGGDEVETRISTNASPLNEKIFHLLNIQELSLYFCELSLFLHFLTLLVKGKGGFHFFSDC